MNVTPLGLKCHMMNKGTKGAASVLMLVLLVHQSVHLVLDAWAKVLPQAVVVVLKAHLLHWLLRAVLRLLLQG
jgi:hypothetical protein